MNGVVNTVNVSDLVKMTSVQKVGTPSDWLPRRIEFLRKHMNDGTMPPEGLFEPDEERRIKAGDINWMNQCLIYLELIHAGNGVGG